MAQFKHWLLATRPKTLFAGISPVMIGTAIASYYKTIDLVLASVILICSLLIQIITNFINEIYDHKKGADTSERLGPKRMVASGLISPREMKIGTRLLIAITVLLGAYVVYSTDYLILIVGLLSILFAYLYTGGPYPLAYNGLGDLFVLLFFGIIAVCGTFYALTSELNWVIFTASLSPGFLSMNILGVNNYRDIDTDKLVNKRTMQVRLGKEKSLRLYTFLMGLNVFVTLAIYLQMGWNNYHFLLPLFSIPYTDKLVNQVKSLEGKELNQVLAGTGQLLFLNSLLISIAFLWESYLALF